MGWPFSAYPFAQFVFTYSADTIDRLFQPFFRASVPTEHKGLGLGLFISQEIARAHGGTLTVHSDEQETRFTFRMPAK